MTPPCRRAQPSQRHADKVVQRLYYGERTGDSEYLNTMVLAKVEVPFGDLRERRTLSRFSNDGFGGSGHMQARPTAPPTAPPARHCRCARRALHRSCAVLPAPPGYF